MITYTRSRRSAVSKNSTRTLTHHGNSAIEIRAWQTDDRLKANAFVLTRETNMAKRIPPLSVLSLTDGINLLINYLKGIGVNNASKLIADGYPGKQVSVAIGQVKRSGNEHFSQSLHLQLRSVCLLMGGDPAKEGLLPDVGAWNDADTRYLNNLRHRARRAAKK